MAFNSQQFLLFFPAVLAVHYALPLGWRWLWLLLSSVYFYGLAVPGFLLQVLAVSFVVYRLALRIEATAEPQARRRVTTIAIGLLVANLFVFKYTAFVNESLRTLFGAVGVPYGVPVIELLLPLGISFYTFQLIGYVVDVFRKTCTFYLGSARS